MTRTPQPQQPPRPGAVSEYAEIQEEIARGPRRTLWHRFTIRLAGQK